jgi:hypothetical protein
MNNVRYIVVPYAQKTSSKGFYVPLRDIYNKLAAEKLKPEEIDLVLLSSNYGDPASEFLNVRAFDSLLTIFSRARIMAIGNTDASLLKALEHNQAINILSAAIETVKSQLVSTMLTPNNIKDRSFGIKQLKAFIEERIETKEGEIRLLRENDEHEVLNKYKDENQFYSIHSKHHTSNIPSDLFSIVFIPTLFKTVEGKFIPKSDTANRPLYHIQRKEDQHFTLIRSSNGAELIPQGDFTFVIFTKPNDITLSKDNYYNLDGKAFDSIVGFGEISFKRVDNTSIITSIKNKSACFYPQEEERDELLTKFRNLSFKQSLKELALPIEKYQRGNNHKADITRTRSSIF